jgi:PilZ domain-containing protein
VLSEDAMGYLQAGLGGIRINRERPRPIDQRSEERHVGLVEHATLLFRGEEHRVAVLNISSRGTMVECALRPRIGEAMIVEFEHCSRIHAFVRWVRDGRLGLNFGHEIVLG